MSQKTPSCEGSRYATGIGICLYFYYVYLSCSFETVVTDRSSHLRYSD